MVEDLMDLADGLWIMSTVMNLELDRPTPIRNVATATVRGLIGRILYESNAELASRYFRPGEGSDTPPALILQPFYRNSSREDYLPFIVTTFDPGGQLMALLHDNLPRVAGLPFGESGTTVTGIQTDPPERLVFDPGHIPPFNGILLRTPLQLRDGGRGGAVIGPVKLTLWHLVKAMLNRSNSLSAHYGNGVIMEGASLLSVASGVEESERRLALENPWRSSVIGRKSVSLAGVVGKVRWRELPHGIRALAMFASAINIGRHAGVGCGCFEPAR